MTHLQAEEQIGMTFSKYFKPLAALEVLRAFAKRFFWPNIYTVRSYVKTFIINAHIIHKNLATIINNSLQMRCFPKNV